MPIHLRASRDGAALSVAHPGRLTGQWRPAGDGWLARGGACLDGSVGSGSRSRFNRPMRSATGTSSGSERMSIACAAAQTSESAPNFSKPSQNDDQTPCARQ
jgi:hypothetical protein